MIELNRYRRVIDICMDRKQQIMAGLTHLLAWHVPCVARGHVWVLRVRQIAVCWCVGVLLHDGCQSRDKCEI